MRDASFRISLDIHDIQSQVSIPVKRGDTARRIYINLTEDGMPYEIESGCVAVFSGVKSDGKKIFNDCIIEGNRIRYDMTQQTVSTEGLINVEIILYGADDAILCSPRFDLVVDDRAVGVEILSEDERNILDEIILSEAERVKAYNNIGIDVVGSADYITVIKTNTDGTKEETVIPRGKNSVSPEHIVYELNEDASDATVPSAKAVVTETLKLSHEIADTLKKSYDKSIGTTTNQFLDSDNFVVKVKPTTLARSAVRMYKTCKSPLAISQVAFVNFGGNTFGFYAPATYKQQDVTPITTKTVGFSFVANHEYMIELIKDNSETAKLRVTDMFTFDSDELAMSQKDVGRGWGERYCQYTNDGVGTEPISCDCFSTQPYNARVMIIGDSFIEGYTVLENTNSTSKRYCSSIKDKLNGNAFINGQGGAASKDVLNWLNNYLFDVCNPEYCIVAVGMNDHDYNTWLRNMETIITKLTKKNIIPILVTVTANTTGPSKNVFNQMNEWIRESGYYYIDANIVTSVNYQGSTQDGSMFYEDGIHPNVEGHKRIFKRALVDVPFLFV